jgi:hypothetical protein
VTLVTSKYTGVSIILQSLIAIPAVLTYTKVVSGQLNDTPDNSGFIVSCIMPIVV